jgi:hypothetical protein
MYRHHLGRKIYLCGANHNNTILLHLLHSGVSQAILEAFFTVLMFPNFLIPKEITNTRYRDTIKLASTSGQPQPKKSNHVMHYMIGHSHCC